MKLKLKFTLFILLFSFFLGIVFLPSESMPIEPESPETQGYAEYEYGYLLPGTENASIYDIYGPNKKLYFYNSSLNGALYEVDLNSSNFECRCLIHHIGDVNDIEATEDYLFIATNDAIERLDIDTLDYSQIADSTESEPISVSASLFISTYDVAWCTYSDVYIMTESGNNLEHIVTLESATFNDVQIGSTYLIMHTGYEISVYDHYNDVEVEHMAVPYLLDVYYKEIGQEVYYSYRETSNDADDGGIKYYDIGDDANTTVYTNCSDPASIFVSPNFLYHLEQGGWSYEAKIHRLGLYQGGQYEVVSKIDDQSDNNLKVVDEGDPWYGEVGLATYWDYDDGIRVIESGDNDCPTISLSLMSSEDYINTFDRWHLDWEIPTDLNDIGGFELREANSSEFNSYNTYHLPGDQSQLEISNKDYGTYYYKIRANDSIGNYGDWSETIEVKYKSDSTSTSDGQRDIPGYPMMGALIPICLAIGIIIIKLEKHKKRL